MMSKTRALALVGIVALLFASSARIAAEPSATARLDWLFDGNVLATTRIGNVIYVGGTFRNVSPTSGALGHLFALSTSTGAAVPGLPIVNGAVNFIEPDGAGGVFIAGQFTNMGSNGGNDPANGTFQLAHIRPDGSADPVFAPSGITGGLTGILRVGTSLVLRGFLSVNGTHRSLVALDPLTGTIKPWAANLPPMFGREPSVPAMTGANGVLYVLFIADANLGRRVAAIDGISGATLWTSQVVGPTGLLPGGAMVVGGSRVVVIVDKLYALDAGTGVIDTTWGAAQSGPAGVGTMEVGGNTLYVAGTFTALFGQPRNGLAAIDLPSGQLTPWTPAPSPMLAVAIVGVSPTGSVITVGTACVTGNTGCRPAILEVDTSGATTEVPLQVTIGLGITAVRYSPTGTLLVGTQQVSKSGVVARTALAAFDATTGALLTGAPAIAGTLSPFTLTEVEGLVADGTVLYLSGIFSTVNGVPRAGVAAVDTLTSTVRPWAPVWSGFRPPQVMFVQDGSVYMTSRDVLASPPVDAWTMKRVDAVSGAADAGWTPPPVFAAAIESGRVVVARDLGVPTARTAVGELDPLTGAFSQWFRTSLVSYPGEDNRPFGARLAIDGGTLYLAGPRPDPTLRFTNRDLADTVVAFDRATGVPVTTSVIGYINGVTIVDGRPLVVGGRLVINGRERLELGEVSRPGDFTAWRPGWPLLDAPVYFGHLQSFNFIRGAVRADIAGDVVIVSGRATDAVNQDRVAAYALSGRSVPSNLRSQVTGPNTVFSWDAMVPPPSGGYVIEGGFGAGQTAGALAVGNATSVALPMPAGPVFIRVRPQGSPEVSNEIVAGCVAPPLPPTALTTSLTGTNLSLAWTPPAGAVTAYTFLAGTAAGSSNAATLTLPGTQTSIGGSVAGGTFFARLTATNACGTSGASGEVFFTIGAPDPLPGAPTNLAASVSGSTVTLTWTAPVGPVTGYVIEGGTAAGLANIGTIQLGAVTSFAIPGAPPGAYALRVRAITTAGSGAPSADVVAVVP